MVLLCYSTNYLVSVLDNVVVRCKRQPWRAGRAGGRSPRCSRRRDLPRDHRRIALKASDRLAHTDHVNATFGSPGWIGRLFLTDHLLAFEITSIVLLVAAVGGVILGSHTKRGQLEEAP